MERERGASPELWGHGHLPLLARAGSKESLEYILQALWRTRRTGLDAADRAVARDALQLTTDAELDPVSTTLPTLCSCSPFFLRRCCRGCSKSPTLSFFNLCCSCWCA